MNTEPDKNSSEETSIGSELPRTIDQSASTPPISPDATLAHSSPREPHLANEASFEGEPIVARNPVSMAHNQIGSYKLLQRIGVGGMGEVWIAEQSEPVRRRVALKLIKGDIGSKEIIVRFEAERQALAMMNHPNIARILDAGTNADGQPYFVMELVDGKPFTEYCDENKLSIDHRLKLFIDVCAGVQHAHQKGIIHRDLKPGNIIVGLQDGMPIPKIIDFGLAKAMESTHRLTDQSLFTGIGQILGTLKYMAPEQASLDNLDIDTRADIYALGVILYELLTGSTPLDDSSIKGQAALKILQVIRDKEAVKPSSKLGSSTDELVSSITGQRQTDSVQLRRILLGDLDWIVMKALEKDRTRRYESAFGFAADIRRYLSNEPVIARPPSINYRIRKFVRKNRVGVVAAALVLLTLVVGIIGTSLATYRALAAESLANERLGEANEAREKESEQRRQAEQSQARAEAETVAKELALAEETRQRQYAEAVTDFVERDFLQLTSVEGQANLYEDSSPRGINKDATLRELLDRAADKLNQRKNLAPEIEARLCNVIGNSYRENDDAELGIPFLKRALELRREHLGSDHSDTLTSLNRLAFGYFDANQLSNSIRHFEQALELREVKLGLDHPDTLESMNNLAASYSTDGQLDKALPLYERTLETMKAKLGLDHMATLTSMSGLADVYCRTGQVNKALSLLEQAKELTKVKLGADHPAALSSMVGLADGYSLAGQPDKALPLYEEALELARAKFGPDHSRTMIYMSRLANGYSRAGQRDRALPLYEKTLEFTRAKFGPDHLGALSSMSNLANCYIYCGQPDKALPLNEKARELITAKFGPKHPHTKVAVANLGFNLMVANRLDESIPLLEEAYESSRTALELSWVGAELTKAYLKANRHDDFLALKKELLENARAEYPAESLELASTLVSTADQYLQAALFAEAVILLREGVAIRDSKAPDAWNTFNARSLLAAGLIGVAQKAEDSKEKSRLLSEAESLLVTGFDGMKSRESTIPPEAKTRIPETIDRLIELYAILEKPDQVAKYREMRHAYPAPTPSPSNK